MLVIVNQSKHAHYSTWFAWHITKWRTNVQLFSSSRKFTIVQICGTFRLYHIKTQKTSVCCCLTCERMSLPTFLSLPTRVCKLKFAVWRPLWKSQSNSAWFNTTLKYNETQVTDAPFSSVCNEVPRIIASTTKTNATTLNRLTCPNRLLTISSLIIGYFKNTAMRYLTHACTKRCGTWLKILHASMIPEMVLELTHKRLTALGQTEHN